MPRCGRFRVALLVLLAVGLFLPACRRASSGYKHWKLPTSGGLVDQGDPAIPGAAGYAGSSVCADCHEDIFNQWAATLHNRSVRKTDRAGATGEAVVADSDGNGVDDFQDGLDLGTDPDFAALGANAPKLSFRNGDKYPYRVTIGALTYDVWRTVGGNGYWRQRYLTRIGDTVFVLPIQYNESDSDWVPYETSTWYDGAGDPLFTNQGTIGDEIDPARSFDLNCVGCHSSGLEVEFDAGDGQYLSGYKEITIGCEMCHGPAQAHVNSAGDPSLITNPADLLDGTVDGVLAADLVCGKCHVRGHGNAPENGTDPTGYPWKVGSSTFPVGATNFEEYYTPSADPDDFWLRKDNPLGFAPTPGDPSDDTWVAERSAEMQYLGLVNGPHGPNQSFDPNCFSCHDPHGGTQPHQIRSEIEEGAETITGITVENNKLCLACHAGHGDYENLTAADVQAITDTSAPAAVVSAVVDHMKDRAGMPVPNAAYDPTGTGVGRCSNCHVLLTATSGAGTTDQKGFDVGDIHSHVFDAVWPSVSSVTMPSVTNSCSGCHPLGAGDEAAAIIDEWVSDPDGDGTFHADAPRNFQNGVANPNRDGGVACVSCHTTSGWLAVQVNGTDIHDLTQPGDADARTAMVLEGLSRQKGITCEACHGKKPDGTFAAGPNPLRFPKGELCGRCHNNQTVDFPSFRDDGEVVRHPQQNMLDGNEGAEVPGETYSNSFHSNFAGGNGCTECHYATNDAGASHTFAPQVSTCTRCHGIATFNRTARADYDGDGTTEGIQDELMGCWEILNTAILAAPTSTGAVITFDGELYLIDGSSSNTAALNATADAPLLRAIFNNEYVPFDGSWGIHNTAYALQLIQNSYEDLTGTAWPGAKR